MRLYGSCKPAYAVSAKSSTGHVYNTHSIASGCDKSDKDRFAHLIYLPDMPVFVIYYWMTLERENP
jgi:hypothetical protein